MNNYKIKIDDYDIECMFTDDYLTDDQLKKLLDAGKFTLEDRKYYTNLVKENNETIIKHERVVNHYIELLDKIEKGVEEQFLTFISNDDKKNLLDYLFKIRTNDLETYLINVIQNSINLSEYDKSLS